MAQYKNLFEAIRKGNTQYFASLLDCIAWPRTTDYLDVDLLLAALEFGRKEIVNHLLGQKCRLTKPGNRVHAIHLALMQSNFCDVVKRLVALGARVTDSNADSNANGDNAIHVAFVNKAPERTIDMLLLRYLNEASENAKNADGLSILHVACTRKNLFIVKKLVGLMGNNELVKNQLNQQMIVVALKNGHEEIVRLLFWCYKQYRLTLFNDDFIGARRSGKSSGGDRWYP